MNTTFLEFDSVSYSYEEGPKVFDNFSIQVSEGVTSLIGPNGAGKSTFLLLASARLKPSAGEVRLWNTSTKDLKEEDLNALASVVYQNMEFETEDSLAKLLEQVQQSGSLANQNNDLQKELISVLELGTSLNKKIQELSKGQLQRAIMAFALLFGSKMVVMDEPVFALEDNQKHKALEYLYDYAHKTKRQFLFSAHELDLSKKYSDHLIIFSKNKLPIFGDTSELFKPNILEEAYKTPYSMLKHQELSTRQALQALYDRKISG